MDEERLIGWTIYHGTTDFPHHYAVRQWEVTDTGLVHRPVAVLCDSLGEAREQIPVGAFCFPRDPEDDAVIVETWL